LVRFNDNSGSRELVSILEPYAVKAPASGVVASSLQEGATVARSTLLARIQQPDGMIVQVRSPLPGRIHKVLRTNGASVAQGEEVLRLNSDENSIWEALRGLALVGTADESSVIQNYATSTEVSTRIRDQANLTLKAIQTRIKQN
jgi:pyruvate/2-oxoglutarate dehydrogenase complex dihydrolipoamide acyltransferase (E2) component